MGASENQEPKNWVSLSEVSKRLGVSKAYIRMLCNHCRLGEVSTGPEGETRVLLAEVEAYEHALAQATQGAMSPQEAAVAAGMYDISEAEYVAGSREILESRKRSVGASISVSELEAERARSILVYGTLVVVAVLFGIALIANAFFK